MTTKTLAGCEWWSRGRGPHATYALKVEGDDGSGLMTDTPIHIEPLRERVGMRRRLASVGWRATVRAGDTEDTLTVRIKGRPGLLNAMRMALGALEEMRGA